MKKIFLILILSVISLFIGVPEIKAADALWNCTRFELRVSLPNGPWNGGPWTVSCPGDSGESGCRGHNDTFTPYDGQIVTLNRCSCFGQPGNQACLNVPNIASTVPGCTASLPNGTSGPGGYCGTNGDYKYPVLEIKCPTPTPTPTSTPTNTPTPKPPTATPSSGATATSTPPPGATATSTPPPGATATPRVPASTATPTTPRTPTNTPAPTSTPVPTSTPAPTNTPIPTPTPTPDFNNAMCKCDQMNVGQIALGQPIQVEAFAKVEGADTAKAVVNGMKFRIYEGNASAGRVRELPEKGDQPVTVVDNTPSLVRYRAEWTASPELKVGEEYRLVATPDCAVKTAFIQSQQQRVVLAERDENLGFFDQIRNFFAGLFGGGSEPEREGVQIQEEPSGPLSFITNFFAPQQNQQKRNQLQLETFTPAQMEKEACNIVKFKFDFIAP